MSFPKIIPTPSPPPQDFFSTVLKKVNLIVEKDFIKSYECLHRAIISRMIEHHPVPGEKEWEQRAAIEHVYIIQPKEKQLLYTMLVRLKKHETKDNPDPFGYIYDKGLFYHTKYVDEWISHINKSTPPHIFYLSFLNSD